MVDREDQQKSAEYMRLAVPLMNKYGITMSPENYAVWYEYVSGSNAELNEAIEKHLSQFADIDNGLTRELYKHFLSADKDKLKLVTLRNELRKLLEDVLGYTTNGVAEASVVTEQLADTLVKIHPDMSREQISFIVQDVLKETRQFMVSGQLLTQQLNSVAVDIEVLKNDFEDSQKHTKTDHLTQLDNRRSFDEFISDTTRQADEQKAELCVILCDLDLFKQINIKHGYLVGDQVLKIIASTLKSAVKGRDFVARHNGEQFVITLLDTSIDDAMRISESIRSEVASKKIQRKDTKESLGKITMSFGVARYFHSEGVESFLQRAERALYLSKRKGRNCVSEAHAPII